MYPTSGKNSEVFSLVRWEAQSDRVLRRAAELCEGVTLAVRQGRVVELRTARLLTNERQCRSLVIAFRKAAARAAKERRVKAKA